MYTFALLCFALLNVASSHPSSYGEPAELLVTMRESELMKILNCISMSRSPQLCQQLEVCETLAPKQAYSALEKCKRLNGGRRQCNSNLPLYASPEVPYQIFDCVSRNIRKLTPEERAEVVEFEVCIRKIDEGYCQAPKYYYN